MHDGIGLAEALLGLDGFRVLAVSETRQLPRSSSTSRPPPTSWAVRPAAPRAEAHERMAVEIRDLACFGRAARLVWNKRRWRCREADCEAKTWTSAPIRCRAGLCSPPEPALRPVAR
jgi:hypothetical protein